jgi:hypothetical protein
LPEEATAPKMRSLALVVVADPLFIAGVVPVATALTSTGSALSMPEYSWMYMSAQDVMAVAKSA